MPRKLKLKVLFRSEHGGQEKTSVEIDKPNPFRDVTSREGKLYFTDLGHRAKLKVLFRSEHGGQEKMSVVTDKPNPFRDATSREGELYVTNLGHRN